MMHIRTFVTDDDVNYYKSKTNDEIKEMLHINIDFKKFDIQEKTKKVLENFDFRKLYGLPEGDIDVLLKQFREDNFTEYSRKNAWQHGFIKVVCNDGEIRAYQTKVSSFRYINKWNQKSGLREYMLIIGDNKKILWIGSSYENSHFIAVDNKIYNFCYKHKQINLFPNIASGEEYFLEDNNAINDELVNKYKNNIGVFRACSLENAGSILKEEKIGVTISINDYFEKGFFYKGIKWNKYYNHMYPEGITKLISIQVKDGLFYFEIENVTYPHYGYFLLDLNTLKITEAKKILLV